MQHSIIIYYGMLSLWFCVGYSQEHSFELVETGRSLSSTSPQNNLKAIKSNTNILVLLLEIILFSTTVNSFIMEEARRLTLYTNKIKHEPLAMHSSDLISLKLLACCCRLHCKYFERYYENID
jgi:hypothetical protein